VSRPLVTVMIPTYQRAHTLPRAIEGALTQTYEPIEVVISDNASTDDTEDVLAGYEDGRRVRVVRHPSNTGAVANWRAAVGAALGDLIKVNWSDDWMDPHVVQDQVIALTDHPGSGFAISNQAIHLPGRTVHASRKGGVITLEDLVGSRVLGLGLPVSPGAALIGREDAEWALRDGASGLDDDCLSRAIGPDLLMTYGALRRARIGIHTGRGGIHFGGGADSITMLEDAEFLGACYLRALEVLLDASEDAAARGALADLMTIRHIVRWLRRKPAPGALTKADTTLAERVAGLPIVARQLLRRLALAGPWAG
jgi:glycosyltransferase involved in cell wall biosynthesis